MANSKTTKTNKRKVKKNALKPKEIRFCLLFSTEQDCFGNGTMSYQKAFSTKSSPIPWLSAKSSAWRLLQKPAICARINKYLEEMALNDQFVDKQLAFLISQHTDFKSKLGGIREYNKLKNRVSGFDTGENVLPFIIKVEQMPDDKNDKQKTD